MSNFDNEDFKLGLILVTVFIATIIGVCCCFNTSLLDWTWVF